MDDSMHTTVDSYSTLVESGIRADVAEQFAEFFHSGIMTINDLDERAKTAIKSLKLTDSMEVISQIKTRDLTHVSNKSAFLCGLMKAIRQNVSNSSTNDVKYGPDESAIEAILNRTGYSLDVTTGQRKYGGPPPSSVTSLDRPGKGCELFCGKIPQGVFEDELIPLFEDYGTIWDLRLMMDPVSSISRGFAFVTFTTADATRIAAEAVDNHEIRPGQFLKVNISEANVRIFVGNIPKTKSRDQIFAEIEKITEGLDNVIVYAHSENPNILNRGFAFLDFDSHKAASQAKRKLSGGRVQVFGCNVIVDWAEAQEEPSENAMAKVKVLYIKNISEDITEDTLRDKFIEFGEIERVKIVKDFAFIHFLKREDCLKALVMNRQMFVDNILDVSLAKPLNDMKRQSVMKSSRHSGEFYGGNMYGGYSRGGRDGGGGGRGRGRGSYQGSGDYYRDAPRYQDDGYGNGNGGGGGDAYDNGYSPKKSFQKSIDYGHGNSYSSQEGNSNGGNNSVRSGGYRGSRGDRSFRGNDRGSSRGGDRRGRGGDRSSRGTDRYSSRGSDRSSRGGRGGDRDRGGSRRGFGGDRGDRGRSPRGGSRGGRGGSSGGSGSNYKRRNDSNSWDDQSKKRNTNYDESMPADHTFHTDDYSGCQW